MNLKRISRSLLLRPRPRHFARDQRGVAAIEFALVLPIVALILLGCFEVPRFVMVFQHLARTSAGVADLVAQADEKMTINQMNDIFTAGQIMMQPFDVSTNGVIMVSSINNPGGAGVKITWQMKNGSYSPPGGSKLGAAGATPSAALPAALLPGSNEEVLAAEVFFNYVPVFKTYIYPGGQLYMISYTRPRNHNLMTQPS
jgi:Flp pilus assembly protein TadG